jgi:uncharacterized protein YyaL (SSP411 family)
MWPFYFGLEHYLYPMANRLINEQSPYLLQHAQNPVDWYPWGDEAFERAKRENKPVIVSIGYAACHWCHVMEHESFENEDVADYMNEYFVCIKVDREEHPDVDHMYMDAVQAIGGSGGWPLNVFATPERAPFYGGTYYPPRPAFNRPSWMQLLTRMHEIWTQQQDEVALQASQMIQHLQQASLQTTAAEMLTDNDTTRKIAETLLKQADKEKGGFGNAPKFPGTMAITYLLEHYHFTGHEPSLEHALRSLDAMIEGGIYDQIGGGFARYATDRDWLIPHFEKMLYDNALLVMSLADAYSLTRRERYREVIEETIAFVERELKDDSGGYYCALDADSEGVEGKFYTWTWEEWLETMGADAEMAAAYFGVSPGGNWEETNILHVAKSMETVALSFNTTAEAVQRAVDEAKRVLMQARNSRIRPLTDDKSLLSWNALMNTALTRAAAALHEAAPKTGEQYRERAISHLEWMMKTFEQEGQLLHTWKAGVARISAKLDDYAYLVQAMLQAASATGENQWIDVAARLTETVVRDFGREDGYFYYSAVTQKDIPVRKVDLYDGAIPSANSVMAHNLSLLGLCMERTEWLERARQMVHGMVGTTSRYAYSFSYWAMLLQRSIVGINTVVCAGTDAKRVQETLHSKFLPQAFIMLSERETGALPILQEKKCDAGVGIFVCTEQACLAPVASVGAALELLKAS